MFFRRKGKGDSAGATAVAERPEPLSDFDGSDDELRAEIARVSEQARSGSDRDAERRALVLRHLLGMRLMDGAAPDPRHPDPSGVVLPEVEGGLPEIAAADLTPEILRAGIMRDGCVLVRGLIDRDRALAFAAEIDRAFAERELHDEGTPPEPGYYEEFYPHPRFGEQIVGRPWIKEGGGVLAADSPKLNFEMHELFAAGDLPALVSGYLGEPALVSAHKTTLRKADPSVRGAWHQDGAFMGDVRALNLWLSLSRCGDESPGLDLVPRRLDELVTTGGGETVLDFQISQAMAEEAAGEKAIIRPIFEPGDALFFDDLFLHQTGSDPSMPKPRYAIENWFFGGSAFPGDYAPIAV